MKKILLFIKEYSYLIITFIFLILNILLFLFTRNLNVLTTKYYFNYYKYMWYLLCKSN